MAILDILKSRSQKLCYTCKSRQLCGQSTSEWP